MFECVCVCRVSYRILSFGRRGEHSVLFRLGRKGVCGRLWNFLLLCVHLIPINAL